MKKRRTPERPPLLMYEFQDLEILLAGTAEAAASFTAGTAETAASFTAGASAETATSLAAGSVLTGTGFIHNKCTAALHCAVDKLFLGSIIYSTACREAQYHLFETSYFTPLQLGS